MLKKYLYIGILLGTIVLAGCSVNEETEGQVNEETSEGLTDGQTVEDEHLSDTDKGKVVMPAIPLVDLTQEQKEYYHKQYAAIIEDVNSEYATDLELDPIDKFHEDWWVEVEDFRQIASDMATKEFTSVNFGGDVVE
ncbi:hypothetical protein [Bacillus sp. CECT 9360]|uniref:hypothetical protein n=1 Tax=Bacillus sp. CECT 9360 TaxID=2845821 RepID=UPI001E50B579|nr:hypothetical protein [Bacillus sp. CECT 9360]CAH0344939.1 hypothetical protein BCI9360_01213 [Bacillus sp. CECT 9360]